ncbi:MAG: hypothetical protein L6R28_17455 [Planctomycetes bacterium]|nr:hypothetical protein [Planctomycetota bacterium]
MPTNSARAAPETPAPGRGALSTVLLVLWLVWIAVLAWIGLGEWGHSRLHEPRPHNRGRPAPALHNHPETPAE